MTNILNIEKDMNLLLESMQLLNERVESRQNTLNTIEEFIQKTKEDVHSSRIEIEKTEDAYVFHPYLGIGSIGIGVLAFLLFG